MHLRSFFNHVVQIKWLGVSILGLGLVSCSQGLSPTPTIAVTTNIVRTSPLPDITKTPFSATITPLQPSPENTPIPEQPTETPFPTETPTLTPTPWPTSEAFFNGARVTFINNAGFMITVGDKKILLDALIEGFNPRTDTPQEILQRIVNSQPPFEHIDMVIATHSHPDHFSADLVRAHLRSNTNAVFVSSPDAVRQIERGGNEFSERLIALDLEPGESSHLSVQGIELDGLYITHGEASILNIGMVITVAEYTFFHSGDMSVDPGMGDIVRLEDLLGYGLPQKEIDLALLPSYIFSVDEFVTLVEEGIQPRYMSPMHYPYLYPPSGIEDNYANVIVFKDILENWVLP